MPHRPHALMIDHGNAEYISVHADHASAHRRLEMEVGQVWGENFGDEEVPGGITDPEDLAELIALRGVTLTYSLDVVEIEPLAADRRNAAALALHDESGTCATCQVAAPCATRTALTTDH